MSKAINVELLIDRSPFDDPYRPGVTWAGKGDVQTVTEDEWAKMKKHTDVWREAVGDKVAAAAVAGDKPAEPVTSDGALPSGNTADGGVSGDTDPALAEANAKIAATLADLDNMTDEAVREFAKSLAVHPHHKKTGVALRGAVREALAA